MLQDARLCDNCSKVVNAGMSETPVSFVRPSHSVETVHFVTWEILQLVPMCDWRINWRKFSVLKLDTEASYEKKVSAFETMHWPLAVSACLRLLAVPTMDLLALWLHYFSIASQLKNGCNYFTLTLDFETKMLKCNWDRWDVVLKFHVDWACFRVYKFWSESE